MTRNLFPMVILAALAVPVLFGAAAKEGWVETFDVAKADFVSKGKNPYFVLEPGYQMTFEGEEHDKPGKLIITVLDETRKIDGVETRVVEEREWEGKDLVEVSRNFFAIDGKTSDAYYFGEEVDIYKNGKVSGHEGAWQSGQKGAHYGMFIPAKPAVGQKYYQEVAPKVAMDRAEILSIDEKVKVPAGTFEHCVKTEETTPLEPDDKEHKVYAPNVGLLIDGGLKLVKYGMKDK